MRFISSLVVRRRVLLACLFLVVLIRPALPSRASAAFDHDANGNLTDVLPADAGLPVIHAHPSNQRILTGGGVGFSVEVSSSSPVTYQWKRGDGTDIDGATGDSLYFSDASFALQGKYFVVISSSAGTVTSNVASLELPDMVRVDGGAFVMGRTSGDTDADAPPVNVTVSPFFLQDRETTKALWDEVRLWAVSAGYTDLPPGEAKALNHPVHEINWWDAIKWCNARSEKSGLTPCYTIGGQVMRTGTVVPDVNWKADGYRLPTEAEWEMAARGGVSGRRFPWGRDTISHEDANYNSTKSYNYNISQTIGFHPSYATGSKPYTNPVGSLPPNALGFFDMGGNVWEWCWDWYGRGTYTEGADNPRGSATGTLRSLRGGSYNDDASFSRCSFRGALKPAAPSAGSFGLTPLGFRAARGVLAPPFVTNATVTNVTIANANLGGSVIVDGGSGITERGVVYSPTLINRHPVIGGLGVVKVKTEGTIGRFTIAVTELMANTEYTYSAYTTSNLGTTYTEPNSFVTLRDITIFEYTVTLGEATNGSITGLAVGGKYLTGTTATLTAVPAVGYVFTGWTGGASGVENPLVMTVTQDQTIGATFTREYTVTLSEATNGSINGLAGGGKSLTGTTATLSAVPAAGYVFTGWTGGASGMDNPLVMTVTQDQNIGATFTREYTVTLSEATNGSITGLAVGGKYLTGTTATLTAVPAAGYVFTGWTGGASGVDNPLVMTVTQDQAIGATFTRAYTVTLSEATNGSITGLAVGGKYLTGTTATLTAVPTAGYVFTGWTGGASGVDNPLVMTVTQDQTIGATFTREYTVSLSEATNGSITGLAVGGKYLTGTTATLTAVPAAGYVFTGWTGGASGVENPLVMTVTQDQTIGATFSQMDVQPIQWVSATRSASPNGSNSSLLPWEYSEPVVVGLPPLPWEDPPTDTLARHYSVFNPLGVDIGLSAHTGLRGGRFTGGRGNADFMATFVVADTTSVSYTINRCYSVSIRDEDYTESDVTLSLIRQGTSTNLLTCIASTTPQILSLVPGRYELVASVHPTERFYIQTYSLLSVSMKALVEPPVPPVLPRELMAPQLEIAGEFIRVVVPESVVGRRYQLQTSVSTLVGSWVDVGSSGTGDGGPMVIQIPHEATARQKFFRLALDPP